MHHQKPDFKHFSSAAHRCFANLFRCNLHEKVTDVTVTKKLLKSNGEEANILKTASRILYWANLSAEKIEKHATVDVEFMSMGHENKLCQSFKAQQYVKT